MLGSQHVSRYVVTHLLLALRLFLRRSALLAPALAAARRRASRAQKGPQALRERPSAQLKPWNAKAVTLNLPSLSHTLLQSCRNMRSNPVALL